MVPNETEKKVANYVPPRELGQMEKILGVKREIDAKGVPDEYHPFKHSAPSSPVKGSKSPSKKDKKSAKSDASPSTSNYQESRSG